ncbi:hypothetical protein GW17_00018132 [Ensete ventricosum]|nr:hypothetical protein GW17_00018132 [Ensete ventricosum]
MTSLSLSLSLAVEVAYTEKTAASSAFWRWESVVCKQAEREGRRVGIPIAYWERIPMFSTHCFVCFSESNEDPPIRRDTRHRGLLSACPSRPWSHLLRCSGCRFFRRLPFQSPLPPPTPLTSRHRGLLHAVAMKRAASPTPPIAFSSPEALLDWIRPRLPADAIASWGATPGTKSLRNLWLEICKGEASLLFLPPSQNETKDEEDDASTLLRVVNVATLRIRNPRGAVLVESHQLLSDGAVRYRHRILSEKMMPGEPVEEAVARAVREELGKAAVRILPGSYLMRVEEKASVSYPGLPARYVVHSVDAEVDGLPEEEEFSTEETGEEFEATAKAIFVRRHFWKWVADDRNIQ